MIKIHVIMPLNINLFKQYSSNWIGINKLWKI